MRHQSFWRPSGVAQRFLSWAGKHTSSGLIHGPRTGLRFDLNESAAFKIEFGRDMRRNQPSVNLVGTQLSFAF